MWEPVVPTCGSGGRGEEDLARQSGKSNATNRRKQSIRSRPSAVVRARSPISGIDLKGKHFFDGQFIPHGSEARCRMRPIYRVHRAHRNQNEFASTAGSRVESGYHAVCGRSSQLFNLRRASQRISDSPGLVCV
ncbi:hypothetical protein FRUB_03034 [Fimbriiglobus ruber]|uniref:Uncharacterized protein n=1 Tax=Fimbriiglobus ruber TaxID=1908690 RepID=A0A225E423_9BACT|nr:hypothetical protein FRUB_03034 [Fimbriiglobus ruber]